MAEGKEELTTNVEDFKQELDPYLLSSDEVLERMQVEADAGLSLDQVKQRQKKFGPNKLKEEEKTPMWKRFVAQFKDLMVLILIAAAILSGIIGDWVEAIVILIVVIVNAVLGVVQEGKAADAVEALQDMSSPTARVLRDGEQRIVKSEDIVPGDIVILETGDIVPADARLIEASNLQVDESALTGESTAVSKDADARLHDKVGIGDRANMVFDSTAVTYGHGKAVITSIGQETEMGAIADQLTNIEQEKTPLQKSLDQLSIYLSIIVLVVIAITFLMGILRNGDILDMLMVAVSLGVAAIPEGMSAVVTIVLAIGMNRMAEENAIVKRLLAVETLGSVNVICSDKTGTLTKNEMTVTKLYANGKVFDVDGKGYKPEGTIKSAENQKVFKEGDSRILDRLMTIGTLCNEAELKQDENGLWDAIGDPTEAAMLTVAGKYGTNREELMQKYPRLGDLPFDSGRKMMSVFHDDMPDGKVSLTKGAPDIVLNYCNYELTDEGVVELTYDRKQELLAQNSEFARDALRVLAFAYSLHNDGDFSDAERDMVFVGFMGMIDPARPEARDSIKVCHDAGIRVVMITGDHKETAVAIAKELNLMQDDDNVLIGAEIENMSDEELKDASKTTSVYARVSPIHKVRIVEAIRSNDNVCSMTGDGVNDAPALKRADIGVAMGITGTEVSKSAADMILTDDNFATIVSAVESGRVIYSNIRKFVGFLLSCNIGEVLIIFITMLLFGPDMLPLVPLQLLWLNLVTDSFPALALGQEPGEPDVMVMKPRSSDARILDKEMTWSISIQAVAIFLSVFIAFIVGLQQYGVHMVDRQGEPIADTIYTFDWSDGFDRDLHEAEFEADGTIEIKKDGKDFEYQNAYYDEKGNQVSFQPANGAMTFAFLTLILSELFRAYSNRSEHYSVFELGVFSNSAMNKAFIISFILTVAVVYIPGVNDVFSVRPVTFLGWLLILFLALVPFAIGEIFKYYYHKDTRELRKERLRAARESK